MDLFYSTFTYILEIIGLLAFSVAGVIVALQKRLDLIGIVVLAVATSCGGGIIRDVLLKQEIAFFNNRHFVVCALLGIVFMLVFNKFYPLHPRLRNLSLTRILDIADALGLATFGSSACLMVMAKEGNLITCIFICVVAGCGGSIMRDIFVHTLPKVFSGTLYATSCIAGAAVLYFVYPHVSFNTAALICFAVILSIRFLGIFGGVGLPKFKFYVK